MKIFTHYSSVYFYTYKNVLYFGTVILFYNVNSYHSHTIMPQHRIPSSCCNPCLTECPKLVIANATDNVRCMCAADKIILATFMHNDAVQ